MRFYRSIWLGLALVCLISIFGWGQGAMAQAGVTGTERWQALDGATLIVPTSFDADPGYITAPLMNGMYFLQPDNLRPDEYLDVRLDTAPAFGDINRDGLEDAAVIFSIEAATNGGNPDYGIYLTALLDINGEAQAVQPLPIEDFIDRRQPITIHDNLIRVRQKIPRKWIILRRIGFIKETLLNQEFTVEGGVLYALDQLPVTQIVTNDQLLLSSASNYILRLFTRDGVARLNLINKAERRIEVDNIPLTLQATSQGIAYSYQGTAIEPSVQIQVGFSNEQTILVDGNPVEGERLTGTVINQSPDNLPPNAVIEIILEESPANARATTLASQTLLWGNQKRSIPFELRYNRDDINPQFTYALRANVTLDEALEFTSTSGVPVITQNNPMTDVEVVVGSV